MNNKQDIPFIKIDNTFIEEGSDLHLSSRELYLYSVLLFEKHMKVSLKTNIVILREILKSKFDLTRSDKLNDGIKQTLMSLQVKGIINVSTIDFEPLTNFKTTDLLLINFHNHHKKDGQFTQVYEDDFLKVKDIYQYHVYVAIKKWDGVDFFECSYNRWTKILNKSRQFAFDQIEAAVEDGIVYVSIGDYYDNEEEGKKIQYTNKYKTSPFEDKDISNIDRNKRMLKENKGFHENKQYGDIYLFDLNNGVGVFNTENVDGVDIYPEAKDYVFFMKVRDKKLRDFTKKYSELEQKFLNIAETRINNLRRNGNKAFEDIWKEAERQYELSSEFASLSDYMADKF